MDGAIAYLLLSVTAILVGSIAQHQSGNGITGLIQQSPDSLTYDGRDGESYRSEGDGRNRLAQLTKKMSKWLKKRDNKKSEQEKDSFDPDKMVIVPDAPTPVFDRQFSANGSIPDDGCDSNSVRFVDGQCYLLLGRQPCKDPRHWVTVDSSTNKGRCTPRLCGRDRVFVVRTGLCHDIYDTSECRGGRRLYYSPYGKPVCDCPIGHYPFPYPQDDCVRLFTQGPCPYGRVLSISSLGDLSCMPSRCSAGPTSTHYRLDNHPPEEQEQRPMLSTENGKCYELGSADPCSSYGYGPSNNKVLGYDVVKRQSECVDIGDAWSPYFASQEENELLDTVYDQLTPEYDFFRIRLVYQSLQLEEVVEPGKKKKNKKNKKIVNGAYKRKQDTFGIFQVPGGRIPLLNPSRSGYRVGKGTNPIVPERVRRDLSIRQAVKPAISTNCGGNQVFIAATGQCRNRYF